MRTASFQMDDRALSWAALLPAGASFRTWGVPAYLVDFLGCRLSDSGDTWLAWQPHRSDLPPLEPFRAVVLLKPKGISLPWLQAQGFTHVRSFVAVPSIVNARWFIPSRPRHTSLRAWDLYAPFHARARLYKRTAQFLTRSIGISRFGDQIIVAQRGVSALEETLTCAVGTREFDIAIASGTPGPQRKVTMQVVSKDGTALAYAKYGDRPETGASVRQEAAFASQVLEWGLENISVPRLVYHGPHNCGYLMVSTSIDRRSRPSSTYLTPRHADAFLEFARHRGSSRTEDLLRRLSHRVSALRGVIDDAWCQRLSLAIHAIQLTPEASDLPTALSHGDFAPWNIRVDSRTGHLIVFDWERGQTDQFLLWDAFHFNTQVDLLVHRVSGPASTETTLANVMSLPLVAELHLSKQHVHALYIAYLSESSVQWFEEHELPDGQPLTLAPAQEARGMMLDTVVPSHMSALGRR